LAVVYQKSVGRRTSCKEDKQADEEGCLGQSKATPSGGRVCVVNQQQILSGWQL
jgi:hypothetical protein